jgi:integrase
LFNVAVKDGVLLRSPAENVVLPSSRGEKRLSLIAPDKLEALLEHAWKVDQRMAGLLAIAFFTGLRMSMIAPPPRKRKAGEFLRLDMIDREAKVIHIPAGIMKTEAPLLIDQAPDCLWGWIKNLKSSDFGVAQNVFNDSKRLLCAHEDVKLDWTTNLARRSAASYMAAVFGRELASDIVGDTEEIFQKHYRVPALKVAGEKYFKITNPN